MWERIRDAIEEDDRIRDAYLHVMKSADADYTYEQLVDRIHCQTEELLATVEDPEAAYQLVKARAGR